MKILSELEILAENQANEPKYEKVLAKIPLHLRVYIPQALEDYYRQVEEYELWRDTVGAGESVQQILPEFQMSMPVEDDDNLVTKEEW